MLQTDYGIKIGASTGFTRVMVDVLLKAANEQGYFPDVTVAGDEVIHGARPRPFMVYRNLDLMDVYPIQSVRRSNIRRRQTCYIGYLQVYNLATFTVQLMPARNIR